MQRLGSAWRHYWFAPASPLNLGLCRALFFGALFLFYLRCDYRAWAGVSGVFWMPIGLFRVLHLPVLSGELLALVQGVWKGALALSCLGLLTRPSTLVAALLGTYLLGLPHNFGKIQHNDALLVFILGIMALSRCGDAVSLDRLIDRWRQRRHPRIGPPAPSGEYTWPVRAVWLVMAFIFFAAGVAKLRCSGLHWVFSDSLANYLVHSAYRDTPEPLTAWALPLAQVGWLCRLLAAATILIEVGFPLALLHRAARWVFVPGMLGLLIGFRVFLGPPFECMMLCFLFWVPWDRVTQPILDRPRAGRRRARHRAEIERETLVPERVPA